jgi:hypothetical protein
MSSSFLQYQGAHPIDMLDDIIKKKAGIACDL